MSARTELEGGVPGSILHGSPDVELAEAQLALGRPDLADVSETEPTDGELELEAVDAGGGGGRRRGDTSFDGEGGLGGGGELAAPADAVPAPRPRPSARLITFLQGSWRELQRVQWPDRRQVMQATGVVLGFVIVAGVFLGVADWAATKIVNYILK